MNFDFTQAQENIRKSAARFAAGTLASTVAEHNNHNIVYNRACFEEAGALGFAKLLFTQPSLEAKADSVGFALALQEIARIDGGFALSMLVQACLCAWPVYHFGTLAQKNDYLPGLLAGKKIGAFAFTPPNFSYTNNPQDALAEDMGDHYLVNGMKRVFVNGEEADIYLVFAAMDMGSDAKGLNAFIMEKGMPGLTTDKIGLASNSGSARARELVFKNVRVPKENLLGKPGQGAKIAMTALSGGRFAVAAQATGTAKGILDLAVEYAKGTTRFAKPLANNQSIQFMLSDMATKCDVAHLLTMRAAFVKDNSAWWGGLEGAMAKVFALETVLIVANEAAHLLGGYGYNQKHPLERYLMDARVGQVYEGSNHIQKMQIYDLILS